LLLEDSVLLVTVGGDLYQLDPAADQPPRVVQVID
jgi:hypothetical protein